MTLPSIDHSVQSVDQPHLKHTLVVEIVPARHDKDKLNVRTRLRLGHLHATSFISFAKTHHQHIGLFIELLSYRAIELTVYYAHTIVATK